MIGDHQDTKKYIKECRRFRTTALSKFSIIAGSVLAVVMPVLFTGMSPFRLRRFKELSHGYITSVWLHVLLIHSQCELKATWLYQNVSMETISFSKLRKGWGRQTAKWKALSTNYSMCMPLLSFLNWTKSSTGTLVSPPESCLLCSSFCQDGCFVFNGIISSC